MADEGFVKTSVGWLEVKNYSSDPTDTDSTRRGLCFVGTTLKQWSGSAWSSVSSGGGGVSDWNSLYDTGKTMTIDDGTMTFALTDTTSAGFTVTGGAATTGVILQITNSGSGNDISGTSATWGVTSAGVGTLTGIILGDDETLAFGDSTDCTLDWDSTANVLDISATTNFESDVTMAASANLLLTGAGGDSTFTITAGDMLMSDGSLTITDADDAGTLVITNATVESGGNMVTLTADAITTEAILYIDNGGGTLTGAGAYIDCNDDGTSDFKVGPDGATTITGAVNSSVGLTVVGVQTNENTVAITSSGVTASGKASLLLNPSGNIADNGTILRIAPSGTPVAGSQSIAIVGTGKDIQAINSDTDNTDEHAVILDGSGILSGASMLYVDNDADYTTPSSSQALVNFTFTGTADAKNAFTILKVNAAKDCTAISVDVDNTTPYAVSITGSGDLDTGSMLYVDNDATPSGSASPLVNFTFTGTSNVNYPVTILKVNSATNSQGIWVDVDNTTPTAVLIDGSGALNGGYMLSVDNDAALTTNVDQSIVFFTFTGTAGAKNNTRILNVSAAKDVAGIYVDVDNTTPTAVSITGSGALNAGNMLYVANDTTPNATTDSLVKFESTVVGVSQGIILSITGTDTIAQGIVVDTDNITTHAVGITGSGALNAGKMLYVANDTTPNATTDALVQITSTVVGPSQGILLDLKGTTYEAVTALNIDVDNEAVHAVTIDGSGALTGGNMLKVDNDGTPAASTDAVAHITFTGTATNNPIVLEIDNSTKDAAPLLVTSNVASATRAVATFIQDSTTGGAAAVCASFKQDDVDVPFFKFDTTTGASNAISVADKTAGSVIPYYVKVLVGTSTMWMQMYDEAA